MKTRIGSAPLAPAFLSLVFYLGALTPPGAQGDDQSGALWYTPSETETPAAEGPPQEDRGEPPAPRDEGPVAPDDTPPAPLTEATPEAIPDRSVHEAANPLPVPTQESPVPPVAPQDSRLAVPGSRPQRAETPPDTRSADTALPPPPDAEELPRPTPPRVESQTFSPQSLVGADIGSARRQFDAAGVPYTDRSIGTCNPQQAGKVARLGQSPKGYRISYYTLAPSMPDLVKRPVEEANGALADLGTRDIALDGDGPVVLETRPGAGACIAPDEPVTLVVGRLTRPCGQVDQIVQRKAADGTVIVFEPNDRARRRFSGRTVRLKAPEKYPELNYIFSPLNDSRRFYAVWFPASGHGAFKDSGGDNRVLFRAYCKESLEPEVDDADYVLDLPEKSFSGPVERTDEAFALAVADRAILVYLVRGANWRLIETKDRVAGLSLGRGPDRKLRLGHVLASGSLHFENLTGGGSPPAIPLAFTLGEGEHVTLSDIGGRLQIFAPNGVYTLTDQGPRREFPRPADATAMEILAADAFWSDNGAFNGFTVLYRRRDGQGKPHYFARLFELGGRQRSSSEIDLTRWLGNLDLRGAQIFANSDGDSFTRFVAIVPVSLKSGQGVVKKFLFEKDLRGDQWGASPLQTEELPMFEPAAVRVMMRGSRKKGLFYLHEEEGGGNANLVVYFDPNRND